MLQRPNASQVPVDEGQTIPFQERATCSLDWADNFYASAEAVAPICRFRAPDCANCRMLFKCLFIERVLVDMRHLTTRN